MGSAQQELPLALRCWRQFRPEMVCHIHTFVYIFSRFNYQRETFLREAGDPLML